ncbi:(2Fe-2S)-binding protein [Ensifer sp.]|uniref:(2Fe-2S)-binding protein n=1 Tax=Ensifer sp. TaxID=1872086 RepID=UPI002E0D1768|nr:(2Fe-2S)-binding protein [Ensifer sp.]
MIVCSCNVLSDRDVRSAVEAGQPSSISQVYGCLGCTARCGRCARMIRRLVDETLAMARGGDCARSYNLAHDPCGPADTATQSSSNDCHLGKAATTPSVACRLAAS